MTVDEAISPDVAEALLREGGSPSFRCEDGRLELILPSGTVVKVEAGAGPAPQLAYMVELGAVR